MALDVTVCAKTAASYVTAASRTAGAAAKQAAGRESAKYTELASASYEFQPVAAVESHWPPSEATASFLVNVGSNIPFWRTAGDPISLSASLHVDPTLQLNLIP